MTSLSRESSELLKASAGRPNRRSLTLEENRRSLESASEQFGPVHEGVTVEDGMINEIPVKFFRPKTPGAKPVCIYAHGGGWVLGSTRTHQAWCSEIAALSDCFVVSVEYRRPPEYPFPQALEDYLAVVNAISQGHLAGVLPNQMILAGDSAGGNLAAAASLSLRDQLSVKLTILLLPVLDNRPELYASYTTFSDGFGLTADDMYWYFENYAGEDWKSISDYRLAPARETNLQGFPSTLILTAECDPLRDEAEAFGHRLIESGTKVCMHRIPGTFHPFILFIQDLEAAKSAARFVAKAVRSSVAHPI